MIAPVDGDHGGSWIGVNQFGLTLCLLNRYGDDITEQDRRFTSRGLLLLELLDCARSKQVSERVSRRDLAFFQPFTMVALAVEEPAIVIAWTGAACVVHPDAESYMPITSSSMKKFDVVGERKKQFQKLLSQAGHPDTWTPACFINFIAAICRFGGSIRSACTGKTRQLSA